MTRIEEVLRWKMSSEKVTSLIKDKFINYFDDLQKYRFYHIFDSERNLSAISTKNTIVAYKYSLKPKYSATISRLYVEMEYNKPTKQGKIKIVCILENGTSLAKLSEAVYSNEDGRFDENKIRELAICLAKLIKERK